MYREIWWKDKILGKLRILCGKEVEKCKILFFKLGKWFFMEYYILFMEY